MFEICYLADRPEHIDACAAWAYGRWGVRQKEASLQRALDVFGAGAEKSELPITFVAVHTEHDVPVGMGSLWASDSDYWTEQTPWIASLFTHYKWRSHGVARAMLVRLEDEAQRLGFDKVHLLTGSAAGFYPQFGYVELDSRKAEMNLAGQETLFVKEFQS